MANLEKIVNELPPLVLSLKLNVGNSDEITPQVVLINNIHVQLLHLQTIINQELQLTKLTNLSTHTLPRLGTIASLFLDDSFVLETENNAKSKYITAKFGNPNTEISINDLQSKIGYWIEWGEFLRVISTDILNQSQLVSQLNYHHHQVNLFAEFQKVSEKLKINLAFTNLQILQKQVEQLRNTQKDAVELKEKLNAIFDSINNSPDFLTIIIGVSCLCGQSGLTLEWLDDDQELIVSSDGKFQELTEILLEYQIFQETVDTLIYDINTLTQKAEEFLNFFPPQTQPKPVINHQVKVIPRFRLPKIFHPIVIIASSLLVLIFSGWIIKPKIPDIQQVLFSSNREETAVAKFKSALKLGLEASALVKNPPYPVIVWQQAETKWQQAIDLLASIPEGTSVYTQATGKLVRYRRNRIAIYEKVLSEQKATEDLQTAQKLATEAAFFVKSSPQSVLALQQAKDKWEQAIKLLENIPQSTSIYPEAQEILPSYKSNYASINMIIQSLQ
ncbi:hypothetical protein [Nodularia spumigena]|uniref:hypothetical protein n=1 Tax=Nodularia spumigena TaxID=70799 RepID=UPI00232AFEA9|nr:hypothetical protein [Nodularia spumigena]MDB9303001.1 hypothetical protein [Nodularia spumigena CS-591/12]MDB9318338.1 hypothetical protein [Nodularia spumigena CS-590/01A]MDB9323220.1 hypothetical protein [Nodularia spumigena CS-591/07A]MDB9327452.1 hypothetical protein [Nodularia spumigena CS-590/02]MDB9330664.1 hypothetical protein [Nodularia spumigena CS-591/04]